MNRPPATISSLSGLYKDGQQLPAIVQKWRQNFLFVGALLYFSSQSLHSLRPTPTHTPPRRDCEDVPIHFLSSLAAPILRVFANGFTKIYMMARFKV